MTHTHLSGLGLVLILVFGCLLLALIAELYYLLWWKKQLINSNNNNNNTNTIEEDYTNHTKEMFYLFCWDKPNSIITHQNSTTNSPNPVHNNTHDPDLEMGLGGNGKDLLLKACLGGEEGVEAELMRLHNLMGPPRFLFTIKEESKEDLESDDGKSKCGDRSRKGSRSRSLGDLIVAFDSQTPFLSPINSNINNDVDSFDGIRCISAGMIAPSSNDGIRCISAVGMIASYSNDSSDEIRCISADTGIGQYGGSSSCNYSNPLFELSTSTEAELFRLRASPPPKFKFLRDAEEKLYRRLLEEAKKSGILHEEGILDNSLSHPCYATSTIVEEEDVSLTQEGILGNSQSHPQKYDNASMTPANCEIKTSQMSSCSSSREGILGNSPLHSRSMTPANCEVRGCRMSSCSSQVLPLVSSPPEVVTTSIEK